jgi:hypothetical protein
MANLFQTIITEALNIAVVLSVDKAELAAGGPPVKVGEVGSVNGVPIFAYLSSNAALA